MKVKEKAEREKRLKELDGVVAKALKDVSKNKKRAGELEKKRKEIERMIEELEKEREKNQSEIEELHECLEWIGENVVEPLRNDEEAGKELIGVIKDLRGEVKAVAPKDPVASALIAVGVLLPTVVQWIKKKLDGIK